MPPRAEGDALAAEAHAALERRVRAGHGRIVAALTRRFGADRLELVENAVQDAYVRALERWPEAGTPEAPERWLVRVAHNALVDALRRAAPVERLEAVADVGVEPDVDHEDELRLMFLCCDPALPRAAQVALVLNVEFGLTARQIAAAFVSDERTVAQRIVRAKQRLREAGVRFDLPRGDALRPRLDAVLDVLYVVFAEGHTPTLGEAAHEPGLLSEALRLARLVTETPPTAAPAAYALRALLCFHAARLPARLADDGSLLLLQEQDRARWDPVLTDEAFACLAAAGRGDAASRFHLEAAIAACHAIAPTFAGTDWPRIAALYDTLRVIAPSPVVEVNRAWAIAMAAGAPAGLDELDAIPERELIARYPYALAAYADLHASLGNLAEARAYLDRALAHQGSPAQHALLRRKRAALES